MGPERGGGGSGGWGGGLSTTPGDLIDNRTVAKQNLVGVSAPYLDQVTSKEWRR